MILIAQSLWNRTITDALRLGAEKTLREKNLSFEVIQVPGALELPLAIKWFYEKSRSSSSSLEGIVTCGCVIKGDTYHFEIVAQESARALTQLSLDMNIPIGNGVLTTYTTEQALERTKGNMNKGTEAALAVVEMLQLRKTLA